MPCYRLVPVLQRRVLLQGLKPAISACSVIGYEGDVDRAVCVHLREHLRAVCEHLREHLRGQFVNIFAHFVNIFGSECAPTPRAPPPPCSPSRKNFAYFGSAAFATGRTAGVGVVFPAGASVMAPSEVQSTDAAAALQHPDDHAGSPVSRSRARLRGRPYGLRLNCDSTVCSPKCGRAHSRVAVIVLHPPE